MKLVKIIEAEYKKLGAGAHGKVFEKNGIVNKITTNRNEIYIANKLLNNNLNTFPKIMSVKSLNDKTVIKREKINLLKPTFIAKINNELYHIYEYFFNDDDISKDRIKRVLGEDFLYFLDNLRNDLKKIDSYNDKIDIHGNNIGKNNNGEYVLFDF